MKIRTQKSFEVENKLSFQYYRVIVFVNQLFNNELIKLLQIINLNK